MCAGSQRSLAETLIIEIRRFRAQAMRADVVKLTMCEDAPAGLTQVVTLRL
jgi:hypothetical protein